jgi:hypothetical protein
MQGDLQDPVHLAANLTVRDRRAERIRALLGAPDPGDDLTNAVRIGYSRWILFGESLVIVLVAVQDKVDARRIHVVPQGSHAAVTTVGRSRREPRFVEVHQRARRRMCSEISFEELLLSRARAGRDP